jgi:hypothetical protein
MITKEHLSYKSNKYGHRINFNELKFIIEKLNFFFFNNQDVFLVKVRCMVHDVKGGRNENVRKKIYLFHFSSSEDMKLLKSGEEHFKFMSDKNLIWKVMYALAKLLVTKA